MEISSLIVSEKKKQKKNKKKPKKYSSYSPALDTKWETKTTKTRQKPKHHKREVITFPADTLPPQVINNDLCQEKNTTMLFP